MPYAKLGYAHTSGTKALANFDDNGLHGGLGLEYKFAPSWGITGEWTTTSPRKYGTTFKNNNFTIGLNYYFSQSEAAPVRAVKEAPSPVAEAAPSVPAQPKEAWKAIVDEKLVRIEGASFDTNSAKLKSAADVKLNEVVEFSKKYPDAILEVSGYTDSLGSKELNMALSQRRAESVKAYLVAKGVAADHIVAKGYGIDNPVADNGTAAGRTLNRRVEIRYTIREEKRIRVSE